MCFQYLPGDDNSVGQKQTNSVCSIVLSIRLELKVAGVKNTLPPIW